MNTIYIISIIAVIELIVIAVMFIFLCRKRKDDMHKIGEVNLSEDKVQWVKALHDLYCNKWTHIFSTAEFPLDDNKKSEIIALLWNVASTSIDCLMKETNDTNLLQRNRDAVDYLVGNTTQWKNLKIFNRDPSTVPNQVIAVYDILKENNFKGEVVAFGYKLTIE